MKRFRVQLLCSVFTVTCIATAPAAAQRPVEADGDPRAVLEKDWGPLPLPAGARYDARCSAATRYAVFFLGLEVPEAVLHRAMQESQRLSQENDRARAERRPEPHAPIAVVMASELFFGGGTQESFDLVQATARFLQSKGLIAYNNIGGQVELQYPSNSPRADAIGYSLYAVVEGVGKSGPLLGECTWMEGGPTVSFGRR